MSLQSKINKAILEDDIMQLRTKLDEIMNYYPKKNKYNAKSTNYNGYNYDSKKEAEYAMDLDWKIKAGLVEKFERQCKFDLRVNDEHITNYFIDFKVYYTDGHIEYVEVKGFPTEVWRLKWMITKAIFHELTKGENSRLVLVKV